MRRVLHQRALEELAGGMLRLEPTKGPSIASVTLTGETDTLVVRAGADGKVARAVILNRSGEILASAPGSAVCDRTDVQMGAEITVSVRVA